MKKGFTLIELLSVIVIVSVITLITFPIISSYLKDSKDNLGKIQIKDIEIAAEKWANDNMDKLDKYHVNDVYVSLERIKIEKYLENEKIINPSTKIEMNGCILIKYNSDSNKYVFEYEETDDEQPDTQTVCQYIATKNSSLAYIIHDLSETNVLQTVDTNKRVSASQSIIDMYKENLRVYGEIDVATGLPVSGLFETDNEYVFAGTTVNNYVEYKSEFYRILSIDKNDLSMKLIKVTSESKVWNNDISYENSSIKDDLNSGIEVDAWENGSVSDTPKSIDILKYDLSVKKIDVKVGLMSVYDYATASNNATCYDNFKATECNNNNYLSTMFGSNNVFTMNNSGTRIWYRSNVGLVLGDIGNMAYVHPVIKVDSSSYITNIATATGSETTYAYELK